MNYYAFDHGSTLGALFDTLSPSEQTCIEAEYSAAGLAELKGRPVFDERDTEGLQAAFLRCLEPEKLSGVFYSFLVGNLLAEVGDLSADQTSCLRRLVDESDIMLIAGAYTEPSPEAERALMAMGFGMLACLPELAGGGLGGPAGPPADTQDGSLVWEFTTDGWELTAPAVVDGVVYVGSDDGSLYALAADSGELLWNFDTGDAVRSIPAVVDGTIYFGSNDNHLYALDAATGEELWRYDTGDWVQRSPVVANGLAYFPAQGMWDRAVHAVDATTGELVWTAEHPYPIDHHLAPTLHGGRLYAQGAEYGAFYALDAATGELAWQAEVGGYVKSAPTVLDGVVYLTVFNRAYAFDEATGELIWSVDTEEFFALDFPALVVDGIYYLAPSHYVYALDAATGEEIWSYDAAWLSTPPVVSGGALYGASEAAEYIFALDASTGEVLWILPTEDFTSHFLAVIDGVLYGQLYEEGYLVAVDVEDGGGLPWELEIGGFSNVLQYAVSDGVVYSVGSDGGVYAHAVPQPIPSDADDEMSVVPDGIGSQDLDGSEEETLLLRYYPPPNQLPKAQIVSEGSVKSVADGFILSADWDFVSADPTHIDGIELPFIWPEATEIDGSHSFIRFHTDIEPGFVFVEGYAPLRPDDIGESPSVSGDFSDLQGPLAEYECSRFQANSCMRVTSEGFVEIHDIPDDIFELPHLLIFAKWSIDPEDDPDGLAMANWVFHIQDAGRTPQ